MAVFFIRIILVIKNIFLYLWFMKDGLKSFLVEEHIHHVAKQYCAKKKLVMKSWIERLILEATAPNGTKQVKAKKK